MAEVRQLRVRWEDDVICDTGFSGSLANAVGSLYVTKYFKEDSKAAAQEMVSGIRSLSSVT